MLYIKNIFFAKTFFYGFSLYFQGGINFFLYICTRKYVINIGKIKLDSGKTSVVNILDIFTKKLLYLEKIIDLGWGELERRDFDFWFYIKTILAPLPPLA